MRNYEQLEESRPLLMTIAGIFVTLPIGLALLPGQTEDMLPKQLGSFPTVMCLVVAFVCLTLAFLMPRIQRKSWENAVHVEIRPDLLVVNGNEYAGTFSSSSMLVTSEAALSDALALAIDALHPGKRFYLKPCAYVSAHPAGKRQLSELEENAIEAVLCSLFIDFEERTSV